MLVLVSSKNYIDTINIQRLYTPSHGLLIKPWDFSGADETSNINLLQHCGFAWFANSTLILCLDSSPTKEFTKNVKSLHLDAADNGKPNAL